MPSRTVGSLPHPCRVSRIPHLLNLQPSAVPEDTIQTTVTLSTAIPDGNCSQPARKWVAVQPGMQPTAVLQLLCPKSCNRTARPRAAECQLMLTSACSIQQQTTRHGHGKHVLQPLSTTNSGVCSVRAVLQQQHHLLQRGCGCPPSARHIHT